MKNRKLNSKTFQRKLGLFLQSIGSKLYALRKERKGSLQTVAKAIKRSPRFLSRIEKGLAPRVKIGTIIDLCEYYNVSFMDIIE